MRGALLDCVLFLISVIFNLYLFVLVIRLILAYVHAEFFHPATQLIVRLTGFIIKPLKKILPDIKGVELSTIVLIFILVSMKWLLLSLPFGFPNLLGICILGVTDGINLILQTFFYAILIQALLSWIQPGSPINQVLYQFTNPIMRPFRRLIPNIQGVDISPIPALIVIQVFIVLLQHGMNWGLVLAHG